ncbi:hypothetical protein RN001_001139 [Aquatica leii]|uniref:Tyr recombinase domain-containing protein n=1 Tax=Aquatica leii TaxID=1421715 RepID=A0AAN7QMG4_9COLE|nr:hypothetical protein RN001_001139 [Aquatica leii]
MLRATLSIKNCIDISKHSSLIAYLKKQNIGYKPKKSTVFSRDQIDKFLKDAPQEFLPHKTALIIGISGACRTDELYQMKVSDVESLNNKISIVIPNTKTYHPRSFLITDVQWINIVAEYINLRKHVEGEKFFQQLRFGKITKQSFGHNTIAQFPKKIATFLGLNNADSFTGHCFRRTSATLLANRGGDVLQLKRLGGWKSSSVAEGYVENSSEGQEKVAQLLSSAKTKIQQEAIPSTSHDPANIVTASTSKHEFIFSKDDKYGINLTFNTYDSSNVVININKPT